MLNLAVARYHEKVKDLQYSNAKAVGSKSDLVQPKNFLSCQEMFEIEGLRLAKNAFPTKLDHTTRLTETGIFARTAMVDQAREGLCYQKET